MVQNGLDLDEVMQFQELIVADQVKVLYIKLYKW